jgi:hypothetical protein
MKKRISKQNLRKILTDFKSVLKQRKLKFDAGTVSEIFDTQHSAIILPTKQLKRIPGAGSSFSKIRFILKSGRSPKGVLSLSTSRAFSHFSFGHEASGFGKTFNRFLRQQKILLPDVLIIKAFHSGEYFFKVKVKKQPIQFFAPEGKTFVAISEAKIISRHNLQIKQLAAAQREYTELKKVAKIEKYIHLIKLNYL